jgi:hypothetical protein
LIGRGRHSAGRALFSGFLIWRLATGGSISFKQVRQTPVPFPPIIG